MSDALLEPAAEPILRVEDLKVHFPVTKGIVIQRRVATVKAVDGVSFTIKRGETLGLVGESGSGKSTTGLAVLRMLTPTAGRIVFEGQDIAPHRRAELLSVRRRMHMDLQERLGLTYLFIAHDLAVVRHISTRIAVMYLGRLVEIADRDDLYRNPLHPYTDALMAAVPVADPEVEARRPRAVISGEVPSALRPPPGCSFHTRCPRAIAVCK